MRKCVFIINGPNLNLLGRREPHIYGDKTLDDVAAACAALAETLGLSIEMRQSNSEGAIVDFIHEAREKAQAVIINAAAYTHTSIAVLDALNTFEGPVIEVHISDVQNREDFRRHSYVSLRADEVINGLGVKGYETALQSAARRLS
ncbi:MAG: type II 3-dehydroquinate dehydratase [Rhodospirillales bacterium]